MQDQDIKYCKKLIKQARLGLSREDRHDLLLKLIKQPRLKELLERNKLKDDVKEKESREKQMEGLAESLTYSTIMGQSPLVLGLDRATSCVRTWHDNCWSRYPPAGKSCTVK